MLAPVPAPEPAPESPAALLQAINTDLACKQLSHLRKISDHIRDPKSVYINWDQDQEIRKRYVLLGCRCSALLDRPIHIH